VGLLRRGKTCAKQGSQQGGVQTLGADRENRLSKQPSAQFCVEGGGGCGGNWGGGGYGDVYPLRRAGLGRTISKPWRSVTDHRKKVL